MGLDTSHNAWHGPYSSFNEFRRAVARAAGFVPLDQLWRENKWDDAEPLHKLLNHSDCDGEIKWEDCEGIAKRLEEIAPKINSDFYSEPKPMATRPAQKAEADAG
jgi:hypothetical protein